MLAATGKSAAGTELITARQGYSLQIDPSMVDLHDFRELVRPMDQGDPAEARDRLCRGLELWRGTALADVGGSWLPEVVAPQLEEERLAALERRIALDLVLGRHREVVDESLARAAEFPLREGLVLTLLIALHRCGRRADALALFRRVRQRFVDELGIEPGEDLQRAHRAVLNGQEPSLTTVAPPIVAGVAPSRPDDVADEAGRDSATSAWQPVHQMPAVTPRFAGRRTEQERLDASDGSDLWVISGTAGVGKTTLAVHWARRVRDRFPDGQLYVNLRGFDSAGPPTSPAEALPILLRTLRVPAEQIPTTLDAQVGLYRSILAGRRMLIVLDNVRDAEQVRPLLPGVSRCVVVITSRNELTSLVVIEDAHLLRLDLLSIDEARELLVHRLGAARVAAEPDAVDDIIARCARLPLALAIVAARAASRPGFSLAALAGERYGAHTGLEAFDGGDQASRIRTVFSWSYQTLTPDAARLFRLLGLHPGPDISPPAAASLSGMSLTQICPLLAELARAHLVTEHAPGRYAFHDLLRAYAVELTHSHDHDTERRAAEHRLLDHYLHTAYTAHRLLGPQYAPITVSPTRPGVTVQRVTGQASALAWFASEHAVLVAAIAQAATTGFETHAWHLAWTLTEFLDRRGCWHDCAATLRSALEATRRQGDRLGQAHAHRGLAVAYARLGQARKAHTHFRRALDLFAEFGDHAGRGQTHVGIGWLLARQGHHQEAIGHARQALALYRDTGNRAGQANALNVVGWCHAQLGDYHQALIHCRKALPVLEDSGDLRGMAGTWDGLRYAHHHLGDHEQAVISGRYAADLYRRIGDRYNEAEALAHLGDIHHATGDHHTARDTWHQALTILDGLGHPDADRLRAKLNVTGSAQ